MKTKCITCLYESELENNICPVCKTDKMKNKKDLTKEEKKRRKACRGIRALGRLEILFSAFCILFLLMPYFNKDNLFTIPFAVAAIFSFIEGLGLLLYKGWSFYLGIVICLFVIFTCVSMVFLPGALLPLMLVYYICNKRAMDVLLRKNREEFSLEEERSSCLS